MIERYEEADAYTAGDSGDSFMGKYAAKRRTEELEMLDRVISGFSTTTRPMWMITVVNKEDLWWANRADVRRYYETGAYGQAIEKFQRHAGARSFQHEFVPCALTLQNLQTGSGQVVASTASGYDLQRQFSGLQALLDNIDELVRDGRQ